jgi:hypothetical protein
MGHCGEVKALEFFSKTQRKGGAQWCQECVLWKEAAEPGVMTAAAPVNELAPDEHIYGPNSGHLYDAQSYAASEITTSGIGSVAYNAAPSEVPTASGIRTASASNLHISKANTIQGFIDVPFHALNINAEESVNVARSGVSTVSGSDATAGIFIPPHLRHTSQVGSTPSYIPPHLRAASSVATVRPGSGVAVSDVSSVSNPYEVSSGSNGGTIGVQVGGSVGRNRSAGTYVVGFIR